MLLAQITDLHLRLDDNPLSGRLVMRRYAAAAVDAVNAWRPDAVIVTGDLTDLGTPEEYALLRGELDRLTAPYFVIPGNHDLHATFRDAFADHAYLPAEGALNWVVDDFAVRLIGLDSVVPGRGYGELATETLGWLDETLSDSGRPTIVAIHHPPFPAAMPAMDRINCRNGEAMAAVIARHRHVERVIAGHHHRPVQLRWAGTIGQIAPSVAHQIFLNMANDAPLSWVLEPPAFLLHRWEPDAGLITHMAYIGDYGGAQQFRPDPQYRNPE